MIASVEIQEKVVPDSPIGGLLNLRQAARILSVSESFLRREVRLKRLTAVKLGRRLLFERAALQEYVSERRTQ